MAKKNLSREEIELRQTTIDVLARTLPNLEEKEAKIVRKHINRLREDIKDKICSVKDSDIQFALDVSQLGRGELVIKDNNFDFVFLTVLSNFL